MSKKPLRGVTLIEVLVGSMISALAVMGIYRFAASSSRATISMSSRAQALQELEILSKDIKINFQKRQGAAGVFPGAKKGVFINDNATCTVPPATSNCGNLKIVQTKGDVTQTVDYATVKDGGNRTSIPAGFTPNQLHSELLSEAGVAGVIKLVEGAQTQVFPPPNSNSVTAIAACFRCINISSGTSIAYQIQVELAASFPDLGNSWAIVRKAFTLATNDLSSGIEILPN